MYISSFGSLDEAVTLARTRSKFAIDADISKAWSLPAYAYVDPALLEEEKNKIFGSTWQVVGRREQVAKPGDYFTTELAGEPLLIARGNDAKLRGFYNVCRHRAGPPAEGCGSRKVFRCGYHGWTYGLDGKLLNAPEFEGVKNFSADEFGLRPIACEEWNHWVFVNLSAKPEPLVKALRELPKQLERFRINETRYSERREYLLACNWKAYIDNYLEGYHLPSVHPGLNRELDYGSYDTRQFERHSMQFSPIRGPENEATTERRYKTAKGDDVAEYFWIFPNWMLNCYPDNVSINIIVPLGTEKTLAIFEWYFTEPLLGSETARSAVNFSDQIQIEDGKICEVVHKNLKSRSYSRGRYSVKQEKCVHHFHRLYAKWMERSS